MSDAAPIRHSASTGPGSPNVWGCYDPDTGSVQYVCACPETAKAAVIDVVLGFDPRSFAMDTRAMEGVLALVEAEGLDVVWILDTHPHADHVLASARLKDRLGAPTAIGALTRDIGALWRGFYNLPDGLDVDASFDTLWKDGDSFRIGNLTVEVELAPGHTLGSISYHVGDASFIHDTLMMPDMGSSRADFPGGSAEDLWNSIQSILSRPPDTRLFVGHDYGAPGREARLWEATVAEHLKTNKHVKSGTQKADFIATREARDATLKLPDRMLAALQINLRGGRLPEPESDGRSYLKMPVDLF